MLVLVVLLVLVYVCVLVLSYYYSYLISFQLFHLPPPLFFSQSTLLKIMTGELLPVTGSVRPHPHLRISKFTQHFIDVLNLEMTPLDYFLSLWPDLTREDARKFLGRFGVRLVCYYYCLFVSSVLFMFE